MLWQARAVTTTSGGRPQRQRAWLYAAISVDLLIVAIIAGAVVLTDLHPVAKAIIALGGLGGLYAAVKRWKALRSSPVG